MTATKGQAIATGIIAIFQALIGVAVTVLASQIVIALGILMLKFAVFTPGIVIHSWYVVGLPFFIPAVFGFFAAGFRKNALLGFYMALNILSILGTGALLTFSILFFMSDYAPACFNIDGNCYCKIDGTSAKFEGNCGLVESLLNMGYGMMGAMGVGILFCLAGSITSCAGCCCGEREPREVMIMQSPQNVMGQVQAPYIIYQHPSTWSGMLQEKNNIPYTSMS